MKAPMPCCVPPVACRYKCPLCSMSIVDMRSVFAALEMEISLTPMPEEYAHMSKHILCNDCHQVRPGFRAWKPH